MKKEAIPPRPSCDRVQPPEDTHPPARAWRILFIFYAASIIGHLILLRDAFRFPNIASDEVQYALTGENLRLGNGFEMRGQFNSSLPPVYPAFVAIARSIGPDPRVSLFVLSTLIMCSAIFPVFLLAGRIGLDANTSATLALAASFLPHTFYAASYMTEVVQYPAYLTVFYFALRWMDERTWTLDVATGFGMGLLLLIKVQGSQFLAGFVIAVIALATYEWIRRRVSPGAFLLHASITIVIALLTQGTWWLYKILVARGTALGIYGSVLAEQGLPHWSLHLALAYLSDFLLAPGLVTPVLLFYWLRFNKSRAQVIFAVSALAVQVVATSTLDGGFTGWLRERLFLYAIPLIAVLSARGVAFFRAHSTTGASLAFLLAPLGLIGLMLLYPFQFASVIEFPWANALGSADVLHFSRAGLAASASLMVLLAGATLLKCRPSRAPLTFAVFVVLFNISAFVTSSIAVGRWAKQNLQALGPTMEWLSRNDVLAGSRLLIAGRHAYFENPSLRATPQDGNFLDWNWRSGLTEPLEWQLEVLGLFDVRMIPSSGALRSEARPGDYFLTTAAVGGLDLKSYQYPFRLYRISARLAEEPLLQYWTEIPADRFQTKVGRHGPTERIVGSGSGDVGYLVYGPGLEFSAGKYEARFEYEAGTETVFIDVCDQTGKIYGSQNVTPGAPAKITFALTTPTALQFRIVGRSTQVFRFDGVTLDHPSLHVASLAGLAASVEFANSAPRELRGIALAPGGFCYVDTVNEVRPASVIVLDRNLGAQIAGWAVEPERHQAAQQVYLQLVSQAGQTFWARGAPNARPDVVNASKNAVPLQVGVIWTADMRQVPTDTYAMRMVLWNGSKAYRCDLKRSLELR